MTSGRRLILNSFVVENTLKPRKLKGVTNRVYLRGWDWHHRALGFHRWSLCLTTVLVLDIYYVPPSDSSLKTCTWDFSAHRALQEPQYCTEEVLETRGQGFISYLSTFLCFLCCSINRKGKLFRDLLFSLPRVRHTAKFEIQFKDYTERWTYRYKQLPWVVALFLK